MRAAAKSIAFDRARLDESWKRTNEEEEEEEETSSIM